MFSGFPVEVRLVTPGSCSVLMQSRGRCCSLWRDALQRHIFVLKKSEAIIWLHNIFCIEGVGSVVHLQNKYVDFKSMFKFTIQLICNNLPFVCQ